MLNTKVSDWVKSTVLFYFHVLVVLAACGSYFLVLDNRLYSLIAAAASFTIIYSVSAFFIQFQRSEKKQLIEFLETKTTCYKFSYILIGSLNFVIT